MSIVDFQRGMMASRASASIVQRKMNQALGSLDNYAAEAEQDAWKWHNYAKRLEAQLEEERAKDAIATGIANGRHDVIDELKRALQEINPGHPLLSEGATRRIEDAVAKEFIARKGYHYDAASRTARRA